MDITDSRDTEARPGETATCLRFRYELAPSLSVDPLSLGPLIEIGIRILTQVVAQFRKHNYEVSEPEPLKKSVVIGATCRIGDDLLSLSVAPPHRNGEWVLLTYRHKGGQHLPEQDLIKWDEIRHLLIDSLTNIKGVSVLDWLSYRQAIKGPPEFRR
jgi:hypothetical protein